MERIKPGKRKAATQAVGASQDIEGALSKGSYFIVQTRPQVRP
jgi:hypothetical protein